MQKPLYNIEFAHLYANEHFGVEQEASILACKNFIKDLNPDSFVSSILIDDFSSDYSIFDEEKFLSAIESYGVKPDFLAFESRFATVADKIMELLPANKVTEHDIKSENKKTFVLNDDGARVGVLNKVYEKKRYTCSMLSSAWTLCRLGALDLPDGGVKILTGKKFLADEIITILPTRYRSCEKKESSIISQTIYSNLLQKHRTIYF